jgi:hypothetical protein
MWYLYQTFLEGWIGCGGYILWPLRSPDLKPMDLPFCGFVKDNMYITPMPVDFQGRRVRIVNGIALVDVTFYRKTALLNTFKRI